MKLLPITPASPATVDLDLKKRAEGAKNWRVPYHERRSLIGGLLYVDDDDKADRLCQHYTHNVVAEMLYASFKRYFCPDNFLLVEPSAGKGAFFRLFPPGSLAFDLDPKFKGVRTADFLKVELPDDYPIAVVGNPPFGKNSSMALRFFRRAALKAGVIAMILPRTFRKASFQNRIPRRFHLVYEEIVPAMAFFFKGKRVDVPTVFQIWEWRDYDRPLHEMEYTHPDFAFVTASDADFAIQRVGSNAGRVHYDFSRSPSSHYFIKCAHPTVEQVMRTLDFASVAADTAGNPSLSIPEIIRLYRARTER